MSRARCSNFHGEGGAFNNETTWHSQINSSSVLYNTPHKHPGVQSIDLDADAHRDDPCHANFDPDGHPDGCAAALSDRDGSCCSDLLINGLVG